MLCASFSDLRRIALGLMLVVAASAGSVEYATAVVAALAKGVETLPDIALSMLRSLNSVETDFSLSTLTVKVNFFFA